MMTNANNDDSTTNNLFTGKGLAYRTSGSDQKTSLRVCGGSFWSKPRAPLNKVVMGMSLRHIGEKKNNTENKVHQITNTNFVCNDE